MLPPLTIRAALRRGAIVAVANWQVVLVEFVVESAYKFALGVPIVGGAFMVAVLTGLDIRALLGEGILSAADKMLGPLSNAPAGLAGFLVAVSIVGVGGSVLMFVVKAGTLAILVRGESTTGEDARRPHPMDVFQEARAYSLDALWQATRQFERRSATLALWLGLVYVFFGCMYLTVVVYGFRWVAESAWTAAWPLIVLVATSAVAVGITAANLIFDLVRVVMVTDDCRVSVALKRVRAFLLVDARQVLGIFGVMGTVLLVAMGASITATAGLALVAWVPLVGLLFVPLQVAFWILRGLVFQYMGLVTLSAYQTQYRRFAAPQASPVRMRVHEG